MSDFEPAEQRPASEARREPQAGAEPSRHRGAPAGMPLFQMGGESTARDKGSVEAVSADENVLLQRLESAEPPGQARASEDRPVSEQTQQRLEEVESTEADPGTVGPAPESEEPDDGPTSEGPNPRRAEGDEATMGPDGAAPSAAESAFAQLVDGQVGAYLDQHVDPEGLSAISATTASLLEGARALEQRPVVVPMEGGLEAAPQSAVSRLFSGQAPAGYEGEPTWLQVLATVRDVCSQLGGIIGIVGLAATVSGLIMSLLVPPVGAFLLTAGRVCDIVALVLDAIALATGIILTGYNLYRLKNATDPEEKARLLALVRRDAMQAVMSGVAVATAAVPGAARMLGRTRAGRAVGAAMRRVSAPIGAAGGRVLQRVGQTTVGRSIASTGRAIGRGAQRGLVRLRGTRGVRWANEVGERMQQGLSRRMDTFAQSRRGRQLAESPLGRFYNRRVRGFHEQHRRLAEAINDPIERAYQMEQGAAMRARLAALQQTADVPGGPTGLQQVRQTLSDEFDVPHRDVTGRQGVGDFRVEGTTGDYRFARDDSMLEVWRGEEFAEIPAVASRLRHHRPSRTRASGPGQPVRPRHVDRGGDAGVHVRQPRVTDDRTRAEDAPSHASRSPRTAGAHPQSVHPDHERQPVLRRLSRSGLSTATRRGDRRTARGRSAACQPRATSGSQEHARTPPGRPVRSSKARKSWRDRGSCRARPVLAASGRTSPRTSGRTAVPGWSPTPTAPTNSGCSIRTTGRDTKGNGRETSTARSSACGTAWG